VTRRLVSDKKIGYINVKSGYIDMKIGCDTKIGYSDKKIGYIDMKLGYNNNKLISTILSTKLLGLTIDSTLSCRKHIDHLTSKLSTACYAVRSIKPLMSHKTLLGIYNSLFSYNRELRNNILGKFLSQYTNFSYAKKGNQNYHGLWE